jgi:hypothetical protein
MITNPTRTIDDAQAVMGAMPAADLPIALFPVRVETRFMKHGTASYLCVRVFPDDVHIDGHEPELTDDEERWGRRAWEQAWQSDGDAVRERAVWGELASRFGPGRAAWIARALTPANVESRPTAPLAVGGDPVDDQSFPPVARRAASWTKPPRVRALPDRWVVVGYRGSTRVLTAYGESIVTEPALAAAPDPQAPLPANMSDDRLPIDDGVRWLVDFEEAIRRGMGLRIPLASAAEATAGYDRLIVFGITTRRLRHRLRDLAGAGGTVLEAARSAAQTYRAQGRCGRRCRNGGRQRHGTEARPAAARRGRRGHA